MRDDCRMVKEDLAAIVDGDAAALARHADHLAGCDDCRDARHEAGRIAALVARAGDDHVGAGDLEARLLAALDAAAPVAVTPPIVAAPTLVSVPEPVPVVVEVSPGEAPVPIARGHAARRRRLLLGLGGLIALAAGSVAYVGSRGGSGGSSDAKTVASTTAGWQGRVVRLRRAAADQLAGATMLRAGARADDAAAWSPLAEQAPLAAGSRIRTDDRTRLWLDLDDGSRLVLDHGSDVVLTPGQARRFELLAGRVAADIAPRGDTASVTTARARLDVLGTRFIVTASPELTSVRVSHGAVALSAASAAAGATPIDVRAGEEGAVGSGPPEIAPVPNQASESAWAEVPEPVADPTAGGGLGSLRAFRPGEQRDRDWNLTLAHHDVQIRIAGPIARTEITETFRNDSDKVLEGVYQFPLPVDARIDSLALDVAGGFEHGAFVDRERAAKIWRGVIDRATPRRERPPLEIIWVPGPWRDPALLEWQRGGRFELRVFPIPAHGARTIKLAYTQVVTPHGRWRQYTYPLAHAADGSTVAERFTIGAEIRGAEAGAVRAVGYDLVDQDAGAGVVGFALDKAAFVPRGDLTIDFRPVDADAELRAWTFAGNAAVAPDPRLTSKQGVGLDPKVVTAQQALAADARPTAVIALRPTLPRWRETKPRDVVFVVDRSQSMVGERFSRAQALVAAALEQLDRRDRFTVLACDSECDSLGAPQPLSPQAMTAAHAWLAAQQAAGASDVVAALRAAADVTTADDREDWIVYIGDGFASTGFRRAADVEAAVSATSAARGVRITTVAIGNDADDAVLSAVARAGGGSHVAWHPGQRPAQAALAVIETTRGAALQGATVELPAGLTDVAPAVLPTIRAGEELLLGARITGPVTGDVVVRGTVGGQPFEQRYPVALTVSSTAGNGFVPRLWASLAIDQLERTGRGEDRAQVVALSQGYGVMSRQTSLLVLESQAMFDAFGVDRGQSSATWTGEDAIDEASTSGVLAIAGEEAGGALSDDVMGTGGAADGDRAARGRRGAALQKSLGTAMIDDLSGMDEATTSTAHKGGKADSDKPAPGPTMAKPATIVPADRAADTRTEKAKKIMDPSPRPDPAALRRRGFVPMRKVWYRVAAIGEATGPSTNLRETIEQARADLDAQPDSRERHRALVQALAYAGDLDGARTIAQRWLERDRLDPEALGYLADLIGRQGDTALALRTQAGTVDLAPDRSELHEAMAAAYERAGRLSQACAHRVALTSIRRGNVRVAGAALRCLRGLGRSSDADLIVRGLPDDQLRTGAEKAATAAPLPPPMTGDLTLDGAWDAGHDLDVALITPQGKRVSWLGGRTDLAVRDHRADDREALAVRRLPRGSYLVEVSRAGGQPGVVRGTVTIGALGQRRTVAFELIGDRAVIGTVAVTTRSRLVPVDGW